MKVILLFIAQSSVGAIMREVFGVCNKIFLRDGIDEHSECPAPDGIGVFLKLW
jgi:hypothetical protein